jgi:ribosomal protein S27AE
MEVLMPDIFYAMRMHDRVSETSRASETKNMEIKQTTNELEQKIDKLELICMALWSLLRECSDLTDEDLVKRVEKIDLVDGTLDGKVSQSSVQCPECKRIMSAKHKRCLYCGYQGDDGPFGIPVP